MSLLHKHQSDRIHTRDLASMTNHGMEGLETDSLGCCVIMGMTLPCCVSHSDALSAVSGVSACLSRSHLPRDSSFQFVFLCILQLLKSWFVIILVAKEYLSDCRICFLSSGGS
jgi:hypothetical protein